MKAIRIPLLALLFTAVCLSSFSVQAAEPYKGYTYNSFGTAVPSQTGYAAQSIIASGDIKDSSGVSISNLKAPSDIFVDNEGNIYLLDSGNNRIIITDENFGNAKVVSEFTFEGQAIKLSSPTGIFVDNAKKIYIADPSNTRVIVCDEKGNVFKLLIKPQSDLIPSNYTYKPSKVVVDNSGYIYVLSVGLYQGAVVYDANGAFYGFYGSNRVQVTLNLLSDMLWKKLMTKKQTDLISQYVPDEFYNFDIDSKGFIYTCTQSASVVTDRVKKLNPKGVNVLRSQKPFGDLESAFVQAKLMVSQLIDINVDENGYINVLDSVRGRIFQYDNKGDLLLIFGGLGQQEGTFKAPVALESYKDKIFVLDSVKASVTIFVPTEFGEAVRKAVNFYNDGLYENAKSEWEKVLKLDSNYQLAYNGIGKALASAGNNKKALYYYKLAQNRVENSKAFALYRTDFMKAKFPLFCFVAIILLVGFALLFRTVKRHHIKDKREADKKIHLGVLFHPIRLFEELKIYKRFSYFFPGLLVLLWFVAAVLQRQATGFRFNYSDPDEFNIFFPFVQTIMMFLLFVFSNWGVCTLLDGKGRLKEIFTVCGYALIPYTAALSVAVILSHMLIIEEWVYVTWLLTGGMLWSIVILTGGLMAIHQYTLKKTVISLFLTMLGIVVVSFIIFLAFGLIQQSVSFFGAIITELIYRIQ